METPDLAKSLFRSKNEFWKWLVPSVILALIGFVIAYQFAEPAPPRRFTLAAGLKDGYYYAFAKRYAEILGEYGIEALVVETAGTTENLERLAAPDGADVAFVQSGVAEPDGSSGLVSVASLYFEPLWVFHRGTPEGRLTDLKGKRIAVGAKGSGTQALALRLLRDAGISESSAEFAPLSGEAAASALETGEVDVAVFVISPHAPLVERLLRHESIHLVNLRCAEGFERRHRFLSMLTLPEGVIDPSVPLPSSDVRLLSPAATLVARGNFHPALMDLLLDAAGKIHGGGDWLESPGEFPSPRYVDFPLSEVSSDYFKHGRRFLRRVLPFWAATLVNRLKIMILPLLTLAFPLFKLVPPLYRWGIRRRINRWYQALQKLEREVPPGERAERIEEVLGAIQRIEEEVTKVHVPPSYGDNLYQLRFHTSIAREKLEALKAGVAVTPPQTPPEAEEPEGGG
ncbi:MAG: TAXI family TRAP transporter solute-binding subunit [Planctomycetota bacterium]|jgi:TRAP transporter TAXI family solute receptor